VPLPLDRAELIVIHSGVSHALAGAGEREGDTGADYNKRRSECETAAAALGVASLREISDAGQLEALPATLRRRARHVVTENARVHAAVRALRAGDLDALGRLFYESHASMRDDYAVSVPEIDELVRLCSEQRGIYGARLTGGGFGGSIVALAEKGQGAAAAARVVADYERLWLHTARILVPDTGGG
jgi:galactokinase